MRVPLAWHQWQSGCLGGKPENPRGIWRGRSNGLVWQSLIYCTRWKHYKICALMHHAVHKLVNPSRNDHRVVHRFVLMIDSKFMLKNKTFCFYIQNLIDRWHSFNRSEAIFKFHVQNMYLVCIWLVIYNTYESILERICLAMPHVHFRLKDTKSIYAFHVSSNKCKTTRIKWDDLCPGIFRDTQRAYSGHNWSRR